MERNRTGDQSSVITTHALFARKVQRKLSNGVAGFAAGGSSSDRKRSRPIRAFSAGKDAVFISEAFIPRAGCEPSRPSRALAFLRVQGRRFLARGQRTEDHSRRCR